MRAARWVPLLAAPAAGRPSYRLRIPNGDRVPCAPEFEGCSDAEHVYQPERVCKSIGHATCAGVTFPLTPFGAAFQQAGMQWTKELCEADSDGDGQTNGEELGDPCCTWEFADDITPALQAWTPSHPGRADSVSPGGPWGPPSDAAARATQCTDMRSQEAIRHSDMFYYPGEVDRRSWTFQMQPHAVQPVQTSYEYFMWNWPDCTVEWCSLAGFEAQISNPYVHHFLVALCTDQIDPALEGMALTTAQRHEHDAMGGNCYTFAGWVPGVMAMLRFPPNVTIPLPFGHFKSLRMNVHYDNPALDKGVVDSTSAVTMRYMGPASERPTTIAMVIPVGISNSSKLALPENTKRFYISVACTVEGLDETKKIYKNFAHMHLLGREYYSMIYRGGIGNPREELWSEKDWRFDDQYEREVVSGPMQGTLDNGDVIQSICVFDTSAFTGTGPPFIGEGTADEMCWNYVYYTPSPDRFNYLGRCTDRIVWTGSLAPGEEPPGLESAFPRPGCSVSGYETDPYQASLSPRRPDDTWDTEKCGGGMVCAFGLAYIDQGVPGFLAEHCGGATVTERCCTELRASAAAGCLCDAGFGQGMGYLTAARVQQLRESAQSQCGVPAHRACADGGLTSVFGSAGSAQLRSTTDVIESTGLFMRFGDSCESEWVHPRGGLIADGGCYHFRNADSERGFIGEADRNNFYQVLSCPYRATQISVKFSCDATCTQCGIEGGFIGAGPPWDGTVQANLGECYKAADGREAKLVGHCPPPNPPTASPAVATSVPTAPTPVVSTDDEEDDWVYGVFAGLAVLALLGGAAALYVWKSRRPAADKDAAQKGKGKEVYVEDKSKKLEEGGEVPSPGKHRRSLSGLATVPTSTPGETTAATGTTGETQQETTS